MAVFEIRGREYPFPTDFALTDPVLIKRVTDLDFQDFLDRMDDEADDNMDPLCLVGLVAVGIAHQFPTWGREKVAKYVESLQSGELKIVGEDGPAEAEQDVPLSRDASESPGSSQDLSSPSESV